MKKESVGQRGKTAEKEVEVVLKRWNNKAAFAYWRLPDARAARGFLAAQPGDFCYFHNGKGGIIEVKSTEHEYRIAKDKLAQLAVLQKFALAGARSLILILHKEIDKWRVLDPDMLLVGCPSWDLRGYPLFDTPEEALLSTNYFN